MTKKQVLRLLALFYGAVAAWWLAGCLWSFASDSMARANGTLYTKEYDFSTLHAEGMTVVSPTEAETTCDDPQFFLNMETGRVAQVSFTISYSEDPGEVTLYYADSDGVFSRERKLWGTPQKDGSYVFTLPRARIYNVRVDPTNLNHIHMELVRFTVNAPRSFSSYFSLTRADLFCFALKPGLAAAFAAWLYEVCGAALVQKLRKKFPIQAAKAKKEG